MTLSTPYQWFTDSDIPLNFQESEVRITFYGQKNQRCSPNTHLFLLITKKKNFVSVKKRNSSYFLINFRLLRLLYLTHINILRHKNSKNRKQLILVLILYNKLCQRASGIRNSILSPLCPYCGRLFVSFFKQVIY